MKEKTDEALMVLYRDQGDERAFQELYHRYAGRIFAYLQRRLPPQADREGVFQEIFMKLHRFKRYYREDFPLAPWLFTLCRHTMLDCLKKARHEPSVLSERELTEHAQEEVLPALPEETLAALPSLQRRAVEMRFLEQRSFTAMARALQKSESNVRQIVSRGIRRLRNLVKGMP